MAKIIDSLNKALRENITPNNIGAATWDHGHNTLLPMDTRSVNHLPKEVEPGISVHLKTEGIDGLSDGGAYHTMLMIRGWHDNSGGSWGQISVTANNNLWFRGSSGDGSGETWFDWKKVATANSGNIFDGEQNFIHSQYCPSMLDTAPSVGCAFKATRGLFNEALIDSIIATQSRQMSVKC